MIPLLTISPCKNPYSRTFLDFKFLFVNRFSKFLRHILGLKGMLNLDKSNICMRIFHSVVIREKPPFKR